MPKKTAAEKAQQELDIAERRVTVLQKSHDAVQQRFTQLTEALQRAKARRDFLKTNPDLVLGVPAGGDTNGMPEGDPDDVV